MERKTITIGRDPDNVIQIDKSDISRYHVRITRTDKNSFFVEDLDSANHTFVDETPIRKATIGWDEKLRLSKDTFIHLKDIFPMEDEAKPADLVSMYLDSFLKLKTLWEETERQKKCIKRKHQRKSAFIRTGIMLIVIAIAVPFHNLLGPIFIGVSVAAGGIAGAFVPIAMPDELRTLEERLHRNYVCPHCEAKLGQWSWDYYAETGKCSNCKKSFLKSKK